MSQQLDFDKQIMIVVKLVLFITPPTVTSQIFHASHLVTGLACIVGVVLQALIPPRTKGLLVGLAISVGYTLIAAFWRR
jgi:hypothetical protein